ncbi:hypothetical protein [Marisediminicola sp. LYQ134]|uniref:hypothetical protein n=1 Tax=Marisediminicola sp. LYQ134 TaxID=3391061 RepID=UPI003983133C
MTTNGFEMPHAESALGLSSRVFVFAVVLGAFAAVEFSLVDFWSAWHTLVLLGIGIVLGSVLPHHLDRIDSTRRRSVTRRQDASIVVASGCFAFAAAVVARYADEAGVALGGAFALALGSFCIAALWRRSAAMGAHSA